MNENLNVKLQAVLDEAREKLLKTRHGDRLTVTTDISYTDKNCDETDTFVDGKSTGMYAGVTVYIKGFESDEDHCYGYSMMFDFEERRADPDTVFQNERDDFTREIDRFIGELDKTDDPAALIQKESEQAECEASEALEELEQSLKKDMKKIILFAVIGIVVIAILSFATSALL